MKGTKWYVGALDKSTDDGITLIHAGVGTQGSPKVRKVHGPITLPLKHVKVVIRKAP